LALVWAQTAGAQENLDHGKTPAQLFASDCAVCHKSPQGLAKSGGEGFLRQHYTASRESAAALAKYLEASGAAPAAPAKKGTTTKRAAKGDAKGGDKGDAKGEKKPDGAVTLPGDNKPEDAPKPSEPKASESKPAEPAESKPAEPKTEPAPAPKAD
jgi:hypothetical protein